MNTEQFMKLAEAYGADIKHWPEAYQMQAAQVIALNLPDVNLALEQARVLDEMFSSHAVEPAERALFESIVSSAPQTKLNFWRQLNIKSWLGFSGLIGTGLAGAVAGAFFVSIWTSGMLPESIDGGGSMAQYVDVGQEWS